MSKPGETLRDRKAVLESDIQELVKSFEAESGVIVRQIRPQRMSFKRDGLYGLAFIEIKLEI